MANEKRLRAEENVCMMFNRFFHLAQQLEHKSLILDMKQAFLETIPADAVEVVHGRWIDVALRFTQVKEKCSVCGGIVYAHGFNYCPNCGAKMDGDGNV